MMWLLTGQGRLVLAALVGVALISGAYVVGSGNGYKRALLERAEKRIKAGEKAKEIEDEIEDLGDDGLLNGLLKRD